MRVKEIITERSTKPLRKSAKASISGLRKNSALDNNNHPYLAYRMGVAMAGSPDETMDQNGPLGSSFVTLDYTDADTEIRKGAEKIMGVKSQAVTEKGSVEADYINSQSITATPKKNKYGV